MNPIAVTLLTGFLGAGKTTLLRHILNEQHGYKIAVIENEFGEVSVDDQLIGDRATQIKTLTNGCICCSRSNELEDALLDLLDNLDKGNIQFDRLVIECTGMADPGPIIQTFFSHEILCQRYLLDGVIALVDAVHFDFVPSKGAIVLEDEMLERMRQLGEHVADALLAKEKGEKTSYAGMRGICPDCHGNLLEIRADGIYCPQCLTKAKVSMVDGEFVAEFTEEARERNRWSIWGKRLHDDNIRKGHKKAAEGKAQIAERTKKYLEYERAVQLPELLEE